MGLLEMYRQKLVTAEQAAAVVKSGDWVEYGFALGAPVEFDRALAQRKEELFDVKFRSCCSLWPIAVMEADPDGEHFVWNSWHFSGRDRALYDRGSAYYIPFKFNELPRLTRQEVEPIDVFVCQVCPMDKHGFFNFGPQVTNHMALVEKARVVIVEVNHSLPRVRGGREEVVHISDVDMIIEGNNPSLPEIPPAPITPVDEAVARLIVEEMADGACLQLGIGGMPNAVGAMIAQSDLKDLGVHTEMLVDSFVDLYLAGKITGVRKNIDRYKMVMTFAAGTKKLYDFIDDNPVIAAYPVDYTNHPATIAQLDNMVAINNAVEVDLFGQICSESSGIHHISGTGGQLDFVQGAYDSRGG